MCENTCVTHTQLLYVHTCACTRVAQLLSMLVYFPLRLLLSFYRRMIVDPDGFPVGPGMVVTHGNC